MDAFNSFLPPKEEPPVKKLLTLTVSILLFAAVAMSPGINHAGQIPVLFLFFICLPLCYKSPNFTKEGLLLILALTALLISSIPQAVVSNQGQPLDGPARYVIVAIIFLGLGRLHISPFLIMLGAAISVIISIFVTALTPFHPSGRLSLGIGIIEAGTVLSMYTFILLAFLPTTNNLKLKTTLIVLALSAIILIVLTGAKGSWLAFIFTFVIFALLTAKKNRFKAALLSLTLLTLISSGAYMSSDVAKKRGDDLVTDIQNIEDLTIHTSLSARLIMWKHAWEGFTISPLTGLPYKENAELKKKYGIKYQVEDYLDSDGRGSAHNEIFNSLVHRGFFGFLSLILLYLVPLWLFIKRMNCSNIQIKVLSTAGICTVSSAFISGLSEAPLMHTSVATTYGIIVIILLSAILQLERKSPPAS